MRYLKFNRKNSILYTLSLSIFIAFFVSCEKDDDGDSKTVIKESKIEMDTKQEIPTVMNRNEKGTAEFKLYEDTSLFFKLSVSNLDGTDQLTVAHIHDGGPVDAGSPVIPLVDNNTIKFQGNTVSGTIKLNTAQFNGIKDGGNYYVNVHSTKLPLGLVRGQLDMTFTYAQNIDLTPIGNPLRPETGNAILRMTKDSTLYYKVSVNSLTSGDVLTAANINVGATGVNGPSIIPLYTVGTEFNTSKSVKLNASQVNFLMNSEIYLSVTSQQLPNGLLRGQIR